VSANEVGTMMIKNAQTNKNAKRSPKAVPKYSYSPPALGIIQPNSVYAIAPNIEKRPQASHTINELPTEPDARITSYKTIFEMD